jgi:glycosyltransferase involved in cell wall biosynthesis
VASPQLDEYMKRINPSTYYIPHGVDYEHFAQARRPDLALPEDLKAIEGPRIGYVGALDQASDYDLLLHVARARPDWRMVLVGPYSGEAAAFLDMPNVHWLGPRDYEQVPAYLKGFDACLIPWKRDAFNVYCNPIKAKEYLAAGRQVVATLFTEGSLDWKRWVWIGRDQEAFLDCLAAILDRGEQKDLAGTEDYLKPLTWEAQTKRIAEIFVRHVDKSQGEGG